MVEESAQVKRLCSPGRGSEQAFLASHQLVAQASTGNPRGQIRQVAYLSCAAQIGVGAGLESRDGNCTRGCGYSRILNPTDAGADPIFHPWSVGAGLRFHPRVDPHPSANKETLTQRA